MTSIEHPRAWKALQLALLGAALASAGAVWSGPGCAGCRTASGLLALGNLGPWGILSYGLLWAASVLRGPSLLVSGGILVAAGIQAGLLAILVQARLFCGFCLGSAAFAFLALGLAIRIDGRNAFRASWMVPAAAAIVQSWVLLAGGLRPPRAAEPPEEPDLRAPPSPPGVVRVVVWARPDCGYCIELDREVIPALEREFGEHLQIERRSAQDLPGMPTPTLILAAGSRRRLFPGLPETELLRRTVRELLEDPHDRQTVLEKPR